MVTGALSLEAHGEGANGSSVGAFSSLLLWCVLLLRMARDVEVHSDTVYITGIQQQQQQLYFQGCGSTLDLSGVMPLAKIGLVIFLLVKYVSKKDRFGDLPVGKVRQ